jgi:DNA-binding winged helix-turn-helix (wHTH) protein
MTRPEDPMTDREIVFDQFRFDPTSQCLWRGTDMVALTPKSSAVLGCLLERAGELVSKDELLDTVWPDTAVSDASLKVCVREIRRVLGDQVTAPRFIATVHRRGYRFIARLGELRSPAAASEHALPARTVELAAPPEAPPPDLVGRGAALTALHDAFAQARAGERRIVFVTGELGIGKGATVDAFLAGLDAVIARGRCREHFGATEAHLPLLEALDRLCRGAGAATDFAALLRARAPTWLAQMPWLIASADRAALQHEIFGGTPERMLREITDALETFSAATPLVVLLEDLHWSDASTLDVLARLAQRRTPARLLVVATYRPVDAILAAHPVRELRQRLATQPHCRELALEPLAGADVAAWLAARLDGQAPAGLADVVHRRTDGNPLFMHMVLESLLAADRLTRSADGWVLRDALDAVAASVPDGVRQLVELQIERLDVDDVALLEAAALAGDDFSAELLAAALDDEPLRVEARCEHLAQQRQWLRASGISALPDGRVSGCYRFRHGLGRSVFAQRLPAVRRARVHQRLGEWLERVAGDTAAAELARHFEASRDGARAIRYLRVAARVATARCANREAVAGLSRALALAEHLAPAQRGAARRGVLRQRGLAYRAMGDGAAAVADLGEWADSAAADGCESESVRALLALSAAWAPHDRPRALAVAEAALQRSRASGDADLQLDARGHVAYWFARVHGWRAGDAEAAAAALAAARRGGHAAPLAAHLGMHAYFANLQADYAGAVADAEAGAALAERGDDSFTHALCQFQRAWALLHAGEWGALLRVLHEAIGAAERNEHRPWLVVFMLLLAWWGAHAGDAANAAARAAASLEAARALKHEFGMALGQLVAGWAALGRGDPTAARRRFAALLDDPLHAASVREWTLRLPLHLGLANAALAADDTGAADAHAETMCELAAGCGEHTYLALGQRARALAAMAARRWDDAEHALDAAHRALAGDGSPLAAWQVWSAAAQLADGRGRAADAARHRERAAAALARLAASLADLDPAIAAAHGLSIEVVPRTIRAQLRW